MLILSKKTTASARGFAADSFVRGRTSPGPVADTPLPVTGVGPFS